MRVQLIIAAMCIGQAGFAVGGDVVTHRGQIVSLPGDDAHGSAPIRFKAESGETFDLILEPDNFHALHDELLKDRLWKLEGRVKEGALEVRKMFSIKDGKRFKVTYYCEICHIVSYRPGRCMCCQENVELQEIPAEE